MSSPPPQALHFKWSGEAGGPLASAEQWVAGTQSLIPDLLLISWMSFGPSINLSLSPFPSLEEIARIMGCFMH